MGKEKIVISEEDKEMEEMEETEEEGMCYGNYSCRANACKECIIRDDCKEETKDLKKK